MSDTADLDPGCPGRDQLWAFLQGELPDEAAWSIAEHVPTCPSCETSLLELARHAATDLTKTALPHGAAPTVAFTGSPPSRDEGRPPLEHFGRFLLLNRLAAGGMGVVYRVLDTKLKRVAALKRLTPLALARPDAHARFARECEAIARLDHPNVVRVYEAGVVNGEPYLVMEYVRGGTLSKGDRPNPLPARDAAIAVEAVARAVHYAHTQGVLHRDLKPNNVLVGPDKVPKVADFGLAKLTDDADGLTHTGEFLGTPQYMAPEQVSGDQARIGERTDVYGLGALLYDLLANQPPFAGSQGQELRERVLRAEPSPPSRFAPGLDPRLEAVCLKCLEKDPANRYESAEGVAEELASWRRDGSTRVKPLGHGARALRWMRRHPAAVAAVVALLAAAVATPFVLAAIDPDRAAKSATRAVEQGEKVVLVDAEGRPQVRPRVIVGTAGIIVPASTPAAAQPIAPARPPKPHEPLVLEGTNDPALVELLPHVPGLPYRLTADLVHESGDGALPAQLRERVGLYFGEEPVGGRRQCFLVSYNDRRMDVRGGAPVQVSPVAEFFYILLTDGPGSTAGERIHAHEFTSQPKTAHRLVVEVRSDRIAWEWDGVAAGNHNSVDIRTEIDTIQLVGLDGRTIVPNPRGGCGLYVKSATLHVRNVTLEPIP